MRVTFTGELNVDRLAKVLNEVFDNLDCEKVVKVKKEEQELNNKYKHTKLKAG